MSDFIFPFVFKNANVRGRFIHLDQVIEDCFENHEYSPVVKSIMIRSLLYSVLFSSLVKIDAVMTFQIQNPDSLLKLMVSEIYQQKFIRAFCRYEDVLDEAVIDFKSLLDGALLSFTVDPTDDKLKRYQGVIKINHDNFDDAVQEYFLASEQSETKIKTSIRVNNNLPQPTYEASCLMIQKLPKTQIQKDIESDWDRVSIFFDTIEDKDLAKMSKDYASYLPMIFSEDELVAFDKENVFYRCRCSLEKIYQILEQMNIEPDEETQIKCEYCGRVYEGIDKATGGQVH